MHTDALPGERPQPADHSSACEDRLQIAVKQKMQQRFRLRDQAAASLQRQAPTVDSASKGPAREPCKPPLMPGQDAIPDGGQRGMLRTCR